MKDEAKDVNLELLIGLKRHLDQAAELRQLFDRLVSLANSQPGTSAEIPGAEDLQAERCLARKGVRRAT